MLPDINLDIERFKEIVEEAKSKISSIYPEWTDYNYHDPGITLIELFAWLKEIQQFYMNQSVSKNRENYFSLLGIEKRHKVPAAARVKVKADRDCLIEKGRRLYAGDIVFETTAEKMLVEGDIEKCIIQSGEKIRIIRKEQLQRKGELRESLFGGDVDIKDIFYIGFSKPLSKDTSLSIFINMRDDYEVKRNPVGGFKFHPLAEFSYEYFTQGEWKTFSLKEDRTYGFLQDGSIYFSLSEEMEACEIAGEKGYFLRITLTKEEYEIPPVLTGISANILEVVQTETKREGSLYLGEADGLPNQKYEMDEEKIEYHTFKIIITESKKRGEYHEWEKVLDFYHSKSTDRHYILEEQTGTLRFGDGQHGMAPEGSIFVIQYVRTKASKGNVKSGKINRIEGCEDFEVYNEEDAINGMDAERSEDTQKRFHEDLKRGRRLITAEDYEYTVSRTPGLMIEHCKVLEKTAEPNLVEILVKPFTLHKKSRLSTAYVNNIMDFLEDKRIVGTKIRLRSPMYINVTLYAGINIKSHYVGAKERVKEVIENYFEERRKEFGMPVYYSVLYGLVDSLECVSEIDFLTLDAKGGRTLKSSQGDLLLPPDGQAVLEDMQLLFNAK